MTFEELDREIELKCEELSNKKEKDCYLYLYSFSNNTIDSFEDFKKFDLKGFLSAYYYLHYKDIDINEIVLFINQLINFFDSFNNAELSELIGNFLLIKKREKLGDLIKYLNDDNNVYFLNELKKINAILPIKIINLKKKIKENNYDINKLIDEFQNHEEIILNICKFYQTYNMMCIMLKNREKMNDTNSNFMFNMLTKKEDIDKMINMIEEIGNYVREFERIDRINRKEKINLLNARDTLQDNLKEKEVIINYMDIVNNVKDLRIRNMFFQVIKNHNMNYLNKLESQYQLLTKDTKRGIIALLNDYGIIKNSYNIDIIMRYSKDEILEILKIINNMNIDNEKKVFILENCCIININSIRDYLNRGIINNDVLENNIDMFYDMVKLDNLKNNLDIIRKCGLSISLFISNCQILLEDSKLFNQNLNILLIYNLLKSIETCDDLSYLLRKDLDSVIDKYLELGCEKYLESDLSLLNKKSLQKLEIFNALGIGINSKDELNNLLMDDNNFMVDDNDLDEMLNNEITMDNDYYNVNLNDYIESNRLYNFDGIRVSIIKVNRLLSKGYNLYNAIVYNMRLSKQDNDKLINILKGNNYKR